MLLKHHETSDLPYVVQGDAFPQKIWANEDILMKGCQVIRMAYTTKCLGNSEDPDDDAIYDPNTTRMEAKKCLREAKMVYLPNLIASSYRSIEKPYRFPGHLSVVKAGTTTSFGRIQNYGSIMCTIMASRNKKYCRMTSSKSSVTLGHSLEPKPILLRHCERDMRMIWRGIYTSRITRL